MPIFQYDNYRNAYGPSIAEALAHQNDAPAQAALRIGDLQAQGAERTAALQGQLWTSLGNIPAQIAASNEAAQKLALQKQQSQLVGQQIQQGGIQLDEAKREQRSRNLFEAESQNPANWNPDGTVNGDKLLAALQRQDVGAYQKALALQQANQKATIDWTKGLAEINASTATADEKRGQAEKLRQDYLGTQALAAYTGLQQQPGDPLHARDWALGLATRAVADHAVSPGVANQWIRQLAGAGPDQVGAALLSAVPPEMKAKYDKEQAEAQAARAAAVKPITVGAGGTAITPPNPDQPGAPPTVLYTAPEAGKAYQKSSVLLDGKPAEVLLDPTPGGKIYDLSGAPIDNAATRIRPIPPASVTIHNDQKTGPAMPAWALDDSRPTGGEANALDPGIRMTPNGLHQAALNYIANGQFPPTGRGSDPIAVAQRAAITSKVGAIAAASGMDEPALRAFYKANGQSLAQQQKMQDAVQGFMATADKNAALLQESLKKIPDTGSPLFNQPLRAFATKVTGDPNLAQFATYLQSVQNEYGRIIAQPNLAGQLTDSARHEAETLASPTATVPQLLASLQALQNEGTNRLQSVGEQIQRIQQRMQAGPTGGATGGGATGFTVTTPDGVIHTFPSRAALDGFKRAAGLP